MKKVLGVIGVLLITSVCYGASFRQVITEDVTNSSDSATISVPSSTTGIYTKSFNIGTAEYFGISYKVESTTADVGIELEQSFQPPTTEGSADATYVEPTSAIDVATGITTESTWYHVAYSPIPLRYGRFKLTGTATNNANTTVNIKLSKQLE